MSIAISNAELEVMHTLWNSGKPMSVQDVCDALSNNKWKYRTVATLLLRMEQKGAVVSEKHGRVNFYSSVLNEEEYIHSQTKSFIKKLYNGSAKDLAVSLFKSDSMSAEDIEEIRRMFKL